MKRHYKELIILERIMEEKKDKSNPLLYVGLPVSIFIELILIFMWVGSFSYLLLFLMIGFPVTGGIIGFLNERNRTTDSKITEMQKAMGLSSDAEMEEVLEDSQRITNTIFMSDRYIMNFDTFKVIPLCNIANITPCEVSGEYANKYGIRVKLENGQKDEMYFISQHLRDENIKIISTAADFAEGKKYID